LFKLNDKQIQSSYVHKYVDKYKKLKTNEVTNNKIQ